MHGHRKKNIFENICKWSKTDMGKRTKLKESGQKCVIYSKNHNTQIKGKLNAHYVARTVKQLWQ